MNEDLEHKDLARRLLSMIEHALASSPWCNPDILIL
jgi:hypothetical protein